MPRNKGCPVSLLPLRLRLRRQLGTAPHPRMGLVPWNLTPGTFRLVARSRLHTSGALLSVAWTHSTVNGELSSPSYGLAEPTAAPMATLSPAEPDLPLLTRRGARGKRKAFAANGVTGPSSLQGGVQGLLPLPVTSFSSPSSLSLPLPFPFPLPGRSSSLGWPR
jgi:hypothetical protein